MNAPIPPMTSADEITQAAPPARQRGRRSEHDEPDALGRVLAQPLRRPRRLRGRGRRDDADQAPLQQDELQQDELGQDGQDGLGQDVVEHDEEHDEEHGEDRDGHGRRHDVRAVRAVRTLRLLERDEPCEHRHRPQAPPPRGPGERRGDRRRHRGPHQARRHEGRDVCPGHARKHAEHRVDDRAGVARCARSSLG